MRSLLLLALALALALAGAAVPAAAQPRALAEPGDCDYRACERGGPCHPDVLSPEDALARLLASTETRPYLAVDLAHRVADSGDPAYIEPLARYAWGRAAWEGNEWIVYETLSAVRRLRAPRSFFWWRALDAARRPVLAAAAIEVLGQDPDSSEWRALNAFYPRLVGFRGLGEGFSTYGSTLAAIRYYTSLPTLEEQVWYLISIGGGGAAARDWASAELRALAGRESSVRAILAEDPPEPPRVPGEPPSPPCEGCGCDTARLRARLFDIMEASAEEIALPFVETASRTPVVEGAAADVQPILECVAEGRDGTLTAFFGYDNRSGAPARVPRGAANAVTPAALDGQQPEAFDVPLLEGLAPGRTPPYPAYAWRASFAPGERVEWRLGDETAVASSDAPRCPQR